MVTEQREIATTRSTEDTGLSRRDDFSTELAPTAAAAEKQYEIQSAIIIAKRFPRDEDTAFQKLMKACGRSTFAEDAEYSFPRGKVQDAQGRWVDNLVTGPSVALAREAARVWTNIRHGLTIIRDDAQSRQIQGWAWDVETNTKVTAEDDFQKLIFRKAKKDRQGNIIKAEGWYAPDERDLRELTNRRGAILVRNCILQIIPKDLVEEALQTCHGTLRSDAAQDPDAARKKILVAFSELNVSAEMLADYLGHAVGQSSPAEIADLRAIYKSISDGNSTWVEYVAQETKENGDNGNGQSKSERLAEHLKQRAAGKVKPETASAAAPAPVAESTSQTTTKTNDSQLPLSDDDAEPSMVGQTAEDMLTAEQLKQIMKLSSEKGVDYEAEAKVACQCSADDLSRYGAGVLIAHLSQLPDKKRKAK